jgi:hypothetical protein
VDTSYESVRIESLGLVCDRSRLCGINAPVLEARSAFHQLVHGEQSETERIVERVVDGAVLGHAAEALGQFVFL